MRPFTYERAQDAATASRLAAATGQGQVDSTVQFLAGGTTLIDLMKLDVLRPSRVVDLGALAEKHSSIELGLTVCAWELSPRCRRLQIMPGCGGATL